VKKTERQGRGKDKEGRNTRKKRERKRQ